MSDPFIAQITLFAGNFAPRGWAFCEGQLLPISQNTALFSILGTVYGGDGRTTFGLPDLRGRFALQQGNGPGLSPIKLGQKGGVETVTLNQTQIPSHTHDVAVGCSSAAGSESSPVGRYRAADEEDVFADSPGSSETMGGSQSENAGGGQPHTNIQPFLCVNYIIAMQGTYPSRS